MTYTLSLSQILYCQYNFSGSALRFVTNCIFNSLVFNIYCYESSLKIYYIYGGHLDFILIAVAQQKKVPAGARARFEPGTFLVQSQALTNHQKEYELHYDGMARD
jgi:hypothetical protein